MLLVPTVAGALLAHTALGLTLRSDNAAVQVVLSPNDSTTEPPDTWEDVDISQGWADPRINGGRFLDVGRLPLPPVVTHPNMMMLIKSSLIPYSSQYRSSANRSTSSFRVYLIPLYSPKKASTNTQSKHSPPLLPSFVPLM